MGKSALVMWGGWDGHTPKETAEILAGKLKANGFDVRVANALKPLEDVEAMKKLNLIVPMWTMGEMSQEQWNGLHQAVHDAGVGIAGAHGGMGDAFRGRVEYQWLVGGQFLGHPYVGEYTVELTTVDKKLLADPEIKIVVNLTIPQAHYKVAMQALKAGDTEWSEVKLTHVVDINRGTGVADMAYSILRPGRPHRANGELAFHVLDIMHAFHDSSAKGKQVILQSTCERPPAVPSGLAKGELDK